MPVNCDTCDHRQHPDGGYCYMFRVQPSGGQCVKHSALDAGRESRMLLDALRAAGAGEMAAGADAFGGGGAGERAMRVGDVVISSDPRYVLHCGCGLYERAVVVQTNPLVLVSESADMRWESTVQSDKLKVVGAASEDMLLRCMRRL